jgi:phosphate:Na+ symporter
MARAVLAGADAAAVSRDQAIFASLDAAIEAFVARLNRAAMSQAATARLARLLRTQRYHETCAEQAVSAAALPSAGTSDGAFSAAHAVFAGATDRLLIRCDPTLPAYDAVGLDAELNTMEARYQDLKAALLAAGADGRLTLSDMELSLRRCSALRRAVQQAAKARQHPEAMMPGAT